MLQKLILTTLFFTKKSRQIFQNEKFPLIPLLAALLFALHPVNVEAVAWIAGRTDPLMALFVLSACWFWLRWLEQPLWQDMTASVVLRIECTEK